MKLQILVVEDDPAIADLLGRELARLGYTVLTAKTGAQALLSARLDEPALMLLDMGLPDMDGGWVLRQLRKSGNALPVIVVTARDGSRDRIDGLLTGADDYVVKPFDMNELDARIQAVLRRSGHIASLGLAVGGLQLQPEAARIEMSGLPLALTPSEFHVLSRLMRSRDKVVTKAQMLEALPSPQASNTDGADKSVEVYIHRIRQKIAGGDVEIVTLRGFGYLLRQIPVAT